MSEVMVTYKVMPNGIEIDLSSLESKIRETIKPDQIKREPMVFGMYSLIVTKIVPDAPGESDKIENLLRNVEGVSEVEVTDLTRVI